MEYPFDDTTSLLLRRAVMAVATVLTLGAVYLSITRADALFLDLANFIACL
jgi:K+ transporter